MPAVHVVVDGGSYEAFKDQRLAESRCVQQQHQQQ